jgi:hypothetical protein
MFDNGLKKSTIKIIPEGNTENFKEKWMPFELILTYKDLNNVNFRITPEYADNLIAFKDFKCKPSVL